MCQLESEMREGSQKLAGITGLDNHDNNDFDISGGYYLKLENKSLIGRLRVLETFGQAICR